MKKFTFAISSDDEFLVFFLNKDQYRLVVQLVVASVVVTTNNTCLDLCQLLSHWRLTQSILGETAPLYLMD